ncbi:MAG: YihY/virulence factor BrkB family protein [Clostridiaceae bacterium]|nr:YihY/virulence factor BrkB family protein [Clostridiaceae bacterium]
MQKNKKHRLFCRRLVTSAKTAGRLMQESAISAYSGQTAFFLMLSFFPYMLFLFAILRLTPLTEETFVRVFLSALPSVFQSFVGSLIHDIYKSDSIHILSLTIVTAVWLGSKSFLSLSAGFNSMYQLRESRNFIVLRIFSFFYSILFAILAVCSLALLVFGNWIHRHVVELFPLLDKTLGQLISFRSLIGFLTFFVFFLFLYQTLPNCRWKIRFHVPGAILASAGWLLFSYLYSFYVDHFSNYSAFYGTMTTIALLMVWLYACMYLLFLGGMLNSMLYKSFKDKISVPSK